MGRSQESFKKKQVRKNKEKKRKEKEKRKAENRENKSGGGLDDMIAYVDAYGNIVDTPEETVEAEEVELEDIEISIPKKDPSEEPSGLQTGKLVMFNNSKGFGFIKTLQGEDVFVHFNEFLDDIIEGDKVEFEIAFNPKGAYATKVKKI